jgi:hypothetical protein
MFYNMSSYCELLILNSKYYTYGRPKLKLTWPFHDLIIEVGDGAGGETGGRDDGGVGVLAGAGAFTEIGGVLAAAIETTEGFA